MPISKRQPGRSPGLAVFAAVATVAPPLAAQGPEEIVVTAQRREQKLQDVPVSVSAFSGDDLTSLKLDRALELAQQTPGLSVKPQFGNEAPVFTMRAIGTNDPSTVNSPTVSVYVDEVLIPYHMMLGFQMFDMERAEVLKGPQGTLYGRNNTGGAVSLITRKPQRDPAANFRLDFGSYDTLEIEAGATGPLTETLAARVAVLTRRQLEGFQTNRLFPGADDNGETDQIAVRGMFQWTPREDLDVLVRVSGGRHQDDMWYYEHQGTQDPAFAFGGPPAVLCAPALAGRRAEGACTDFFGYFDPDDDPHAGDFNTAWDDDGDGKTESDFSTWGSGITINWQLPGMTLTTVTGYERFSRDATEDTDQSPLIALEAGFFEDIDAVSQEVRLTSDDSWPIDWLTGLYYYTDNITGSTVFLMRDLLGTDLAHQYDQDVEAIAGFAHASWPFREQWRLNAGIRVTHETRTMTQRVTDLNNYGISLFTQPASFCGFLGICGIPGLGFEGLAAAPPTFGSAPMVDVNGREIDLTDVSGEVGLDWKLTDDLLLYGKFSKGFKSGGFNSLVVFAPADAEPYGDETVLAWEGGFKSEFAGGLARLNGAIFYMEWNDFQAQIGRTGGEFPVDNAGDAEILGAELDLEWYPLEGLMLRAGFGWLDTEIVETNPDLAIDLDGNELHDAPRYEWSGVARYSHPLPWLALVGSAQLDWSWQDDIFFEVKNVPPASQAAYGLLNARVSVADGGDRWQVAIWGRNLTEEVYATENFDFTGTNGTTVRIAGYPREAGISLSYRWE